MRRSSLIIVLFGLSVLALSQDQPSQPKLITMNLPDHPGPPVGTQLKKAVAIVDVSCKDANGKLWPTSGTGFTVAYHDPRVPKDQHFDYLVTNRHVAECRDEKGIPREVQSVSLEVNMKNGTWGTGPINQDGKVRWYFPTDDSVDLALTPISLSANVEYLPIPLDMFLAKEDFAADNIGEGAKIILSGYSYHFEGEPHRQALVREGILSAMPEVPLKTTTGKQGTVYLADVHIFGGNSGSPVFISTAGFRSGGGIVFEDYRFLGVASGFYNEDSDFNLEIATTVTGTQHANSGISMIVPADFLKDLILNNPALKKLREDVVTAESTKK